MTRARRLILLAGLVLAAALAGSVSAQTTLRINIALAQNSHYGVAIDTFAREVERRTSGRYRVQTFYSAALGAERECDGHAQCEQRDAANEQRGDHAQGLAASASNWPSARTARRAM
jgi:hypothetical protein